MRPKSTYSVSGKNLALSNVLKTIGYKLYPTVTLVKSIVVVTKKVMML